MEVITTVPNDYYCPISLQLMVNPYVSKYGHSFEFQEIEKWIKQNQKCPITRKTLTLDDVFPNTSLKNSIDEIRSKVSIEQLKQKVETQNNSNKNIDTKLDDIYLHSYIDKCHSELMISVDMPENDTRQPIDVLLCIDISGSMGADATLKTSTGENISHGISVLSLTVSAAKTILHSLQENDTISIVTYSTYSEVLVNNQSINPSSIDSIEKQLDSLKPCGTTNLWDGIYTSLECLKEFSPPNKNKVIMLLTDGLPSEHQLPVRGIEYMLEKYYTNNKNYYNNQDFHCMINTFGFGYSLNSVLLDKISKISGGDGFNYIPDSSLLGNIFIHSISNSLTTAVSDVKLQLKLEKVNFSDCLSESKTINISSLKYGQSKDFIFKIRLPEKYSDKIEFKIISTRFRKEGTIYTNPDLKIKFLEEHYRTQAVCLLRSCIQKMNFNEKDNVRELITKYINSINENKDALKNKYIMNILYDFEGQIKEALNMTRVGETEDWFSRWGKHYLLSLTDAYSNQLCNNFKDKAVSNFGGTLFTKLVDKVSDIFDNLPPPKRDIYSTNSYKSTSTYNLPQTPIDMRQFRNIGGGCCKKGSRIKMADLSLQKVELLQKGDKVVTISNENIEEISTVECVVKTFCDDNKQSMVQLNSYIDGGAFYITPYHPVKQINNKNWIFPTDINLTNIIPCDEMYTFVVTNRKSVLVEDYVFATYGHGIKENIVYHDYFGSNKVIQDLQEIVGYYQGLVCLTQDMFKRDINTNTIYKIEYNIKNIVDNYIHNEYYISKL